MTIYSKCDEVEDGETKLQQNLETTIELKHEEKNT